MKKLSFLALAAVGLLFGACSDSDLDSGKNPDVFSGNGNGYIKVGISIPTNVTTRAWGETDSKLADGLKEEYGVTTAYLLLFEGASESAAKLKQIVTLSAFTNKVGTAVDQVTINSGDNSFVAKIDNAPSSDLWALAVINSAGIISPSTTPGAIIDVNGTAVTTDVTISSLQALYGMTAPSASEKYQEKLPFVNKTTGHIFMSNAVLFDKQGGTVDPGEVFKGHILVKVNSDFIYSTESAAQTGERAADIYVERGVAKVTIEGNAANSKSITVNAKEYDNTTAALTAEIVDWTLTNTNLKSYDVRKVPAIDWNLASMSTAAGTDKYRFVGNTAVDAPYGTALAGYRTYWAEDPNYADGVITDLYTAKTIDFTDKIGEENPLYCFENTFDVDHQTVKNTTCAIVQVRVQTDAMTDDKSGTYKNLYTVGENKKVFYTKEDVEKLAATRLFSIPEFQTWFDNNHATGITELEGTDVTLTFSTGVSPTVTNIAVNPAKLKSTPDAIPATVITSLNSASIMGGIARYEGGIAYYYVRIQHFGDDLTPWNKSGAAQEWDGSGTPADQYAPKEGSPTTTAMIYPEGSDTRANANYLGRYGVVRNNWYHLILTTLSGMGSTTVPNLTTEEHPDDEIEDLYIKARINILSWARRPQSWDLK